MVCRGYHGTSIISNTLIGTFSTAENSQWVDAYTGTPTQWLILWVLQKMHILSIPAVIVVFAGGGS